MSREENFWARVSRSFGLSAEAAPVLAESWLYSTSAYSDDEQAMYDFVYVRLPELRSSGMYS